MHMPVGYQKIILYEVLSLCIFSVRCSSELDMCLYVEIV
jgi:hypothetical protein